MAVPFLSAIFSAISFVAGVIEQVGPVIGKVVTEIIGGLSFSIR